MTTFLIQQDRGHPSFNQAPQLDHFIHWGMFIIHSSGHALKLLSEIHVVYEVTIEVHSLHMAFNLTIP